MKEKQLKALQDSVHFERIFTSQSPLNFEKSHRIPLDQTGLNRYDSLFYLIDRVSLEVNALCTSEIFLCVRHYFDGNLDQNELKTVSDLDRFFIDHEEGMFSKGSNVTDKDGDLASFHIIGLKRKQLKTLLFAHYAKFMRFEGFCLRGEVHLFSITDKCSLHLYDDRGMDVVFWD